MSDNSYSLPQDYPTIDTTTTTATTTTATTTTATTNSIDTPPSPTTTTTPAAAAEEEEGEFHLERSPSIEASSSDHHQHHHSEIDADDTENDMDYDDDGDDCSMSSSDESDDVLQEKTLQVIVAAPGDDGNSGRDDADKTEQNNDFDNDQNKKLTSSSLSLSTAKLYEGEYNQVSDVGDDDDDSDIAWDEPGRDESEESAAASEASEAVAQEADVSQETTFEELYPLLAHIEYETNEYPDDIGSYEDVKKLEQERRETSRRKSTPNMSRFSASVRLGKATEDAALLEESYQIVFGKWPVLRRHESRYMRVPPPEFRLPSEEMDLSGFFRTVDRDSSASLSDNLGSITDSDLLSANQALLSTAYTSRMSVDTLSQDLLSANPSNDHLHLQLPPTQGNRHSNRRSVTITSISELSAVSRTSASTSSSTLPRLSVTTIEGSAAGSIHPPPPPPPPPHLGLSKRKRDDSIGRDSISLPSYKLIPVNAFEVGAVVGGGNVRGGKKKLTLGTLFGGRSNRSSSGNSSSNSHRKSPHESTASISSTASTSSTSSSHSKRRSGAWQSTGPAMMQPNIASNTSPRSNQRQQPIAEQVLSHELIESDLDKIKLFSIDAPIRSDMTCEESTIDRLISVYEPRPRFSETGSTSRDTMRKALISPYTDTRFIYTLIKFTSLNFVNGPIEPLFCRMALYDAVNQCKISEDFGFYVNDASMKKNLCAQMQQRVQDALDNAIYNEPTALFRVQEPNADIYVVMWFDRILQGSTEDAVKYYRDNPRGLEKYLQRNKEVCHTMSHIRQPFLWGFFKLFYRSSESTVGVSEGTRTVRKLHLVPTSSNASSPFDILSVLMDPDSHDATRDRNSVECTLRFEVNHASPDKLQDFSINFNNQSRTRKLKRKREFPPIKGYGRYGFDSHIQRYFTLVHDFPIYVPTTPNLVFRNSLYVYPDFAEVVGVKSKHVNVVLRISFRESDKIGTGGEQPRIVDPFDSGQMRNSVLTSVSYSQKSPQFFDEIKIELPLHPTATANILIEIFTVKTAKPTGSMSPSLDPLTDFGGAHVTRVGCAFLHLFEDNAFTSDGVHTLPVYKKLKDDYISNIDTMDRENRMSVTLRTRHASTIYPKDRNASKFLHVCNRFYDFFQYYEDPNVGEENLRSASFFHRLEDLMTNCGDSLSNLREANYIELIQYAPVIFNIIFKTSAKLMMLYPPDESAGEEENDDELRVRIILRERVPMFVGKLFEMLLFFQSNLVSVTKEKGRMNSHMSRYVQYFFTNLVNTHIPSYMCILELWIQFLVEHKDKSNDQFNPAFDWFANEVLSGKTWARMSLAEPQSQTIFLHQLQVAEQEVFRPDSLCSMDSIRFTWFFFDLIFKSLLMYTHLDEFQQPNSRFNKQYVLNDQQLKPRLLQLLHLIVPVLAEGIDKRYSHMYLKDFAREANQEFAVFLRDLLSIMGPSFVLDIVQQYLKALTASSSSPYPRTYLKLEFLDVFCRHDSIIHMIAHEGYGFLVSEMVDSVIAGVLDDADDLRVLALQTFKLHLLKQDFDATLQDWRQLIADLYLPLAQNILDHHKSIVHNASKSGLLPDLLVILFHILHNASREKVTALFVCDREQSTYLPPITKEGDTFVNALYKLQVTMVILMRRDDDKKLAMCMTKSILRLFDEVLVKQYLEPNMNDHLRIFEELKQHERERLEKEEEMKRRAKELKTQLKAGGLMSLKHRSSLKDIRSSMTDSSDSCDNKEGGDMDSIQREEEKEEALQTILEEKNRRLDVFVETFERCCHLLLNIVLNTPRMDTSTIQDFLDSTVFPFIQVFKPLFPVSVERRKRYRDLQVFVEDESSEFATSWNSLLGGLLFQYGLPADYRSHPSLVRSVRALLSVYVKDLKYDMLDAEEEEEEEQDATAKEYLEMDLSSESDASTATDVTTQSTQPECADCSWDQSASDDGKEEKDGVPDVVASTENYDETMEVADAVRGSSVEEHDENHADSGNDNKEAEMQNVGSEDDQNQMHEQEQVETVEEQGTGQQQEQLDSSSTTTPSNTDMDADEEDEIEYAPNGSTIIGGTLRKLVERLFSDDKSHPPFHHIFFLTYLSFADPFEVLEEMKGCIARLIDTDPLNDTGAEKIKREKRIVRFMLVLKHWIKDHYSDLDAAFVAHLIHFMDNDFARTVYKFKGDRTQQLLLPIQRILAKQIVEVEQLKLTYLSKNLPQPKIPRHFTQAMLNNTIPAEFNLLEWDSMEIARQMTLIDFGLFKAIHHKELFGKARTGDNRHITAPNVTAISDRFNNMSSWIYSTIVRIEDVNARAEVMKKFVDIAEKLRHLNNFNGLNYMLSGMENNAIHRLKKTWALIPDEEDRFKSLKKIMAHPYDEYRRALDQAVPPCCPFLGVALTDFTFIDETSDFLMPNNVRKLKLINMHKRNLYVRGIELIKQKQQKPYEFKVVPFLIKTISMDIFNDNMDSDEAWDRSVELEPPVGGFLY